MTKFRLGESAKILVKKRTLQKDWKHIKKQDFTEDINELTGEAHHSFDPRSESGLGGIHTSKHIKYDPTITKKFGTDVDPSKVETTDLIGERISGLVTKKKEKVETKFINTLDKGFKSTILSNQKKFLKGVKRDLPEFKAQLKVPGVKGTSKERALLVFAEQKKRTIPKFQYTKKGLELQQKQEKYKTHALALAEAKSQRLQKALEKRYGRSERRIWDKDPKYVRETKYFKRTPITDEALADMGLTRETYINPSLAGRTRQEQILTESMAIQASIGRKGKKIIPHEEWKEIGQIVVGRRKKGAPKETFKVGSELLGSRVKTLDPPTFAKDVGRKFRIESSFIKSAKLGKGEGKKIKQIRLFDPKTKQHYYKDKSLHELKRDKGYAQVGMKSKSMPRRFIPERYPHISKKRPTYPWE